jgi:hypothetical protein
MKTEAPSSTKRFAVAKPISLGAAGNHGHLSLQLAHNRHFFFSFFADEACSIWQCV